MTKTETWKQVQALLVEQKASKKLTQALEELLAPKSSSSTNPPKEIDGTMHYYCRFHQAYEPQEDMVMSAGKSKGYCKASISKWNKMNASIKKLNDQAVCAMSEGQMEDAQECAKQSEAIKAKLNNPESYDIVQDWADFNGITKALEAE